MRDFFKKNNFSLIRLFCALHVVLNHSLEHLNITIGDASWLRVIGLFPSVPVFFLVSGYLTSAAYESNSRRGLAFYAQNRFFRIWPGIAICFLLSLASVYLSGYFLSERPSPMDFSLWVIAQLTLFSFYSPDFMRGYGVGVLNGSLWTISVIVQFYIFTPIFYFLMKFFGRRKSLENIYISSIIVLFIVLSQVFVELYLSGERDLWVRLVNVSIIPWLYMFLVGVFLQRNFVFFYSFLEKKGFLLIILYIVLGGWIIEVFGIRMGNRLNPLAFLILAPVVFSAAYTWPSLSSRLIGQNDISFGLFMYHMPIINFVIYCGIQSYLMEFNQWSAILLVFSSSIIFASASWFLVERYGTQMKESRFNIFIKFSRDKSHV